MTNFPNLNPRSGHQDKNYYFHENNEGSLLFMLSFVGKVYERVPRSS